MSTVLVARVELTGHFAEWRKATGLIHVCRPDRSEVSSHFLQDAALQSLQRVACADVRGSLLVLTPEH